MYLVQSKLLVFVSLVYVVNGAPQSPTVVENQQNDRCAEGFTDWNPQSTFCYKIVTDKKNWTDAENHCKSSDHGNLASIHSLEQNEMFKKRWTKRN